MTAARDLGHLARRFLGSLTAHALSAEEQGWVTTHLLRREVELWECMSVADQRHAYGVARQVDAVMGAETSRPVLAAALLHDIGKLESKLGTIGRSVATVLANVGIKRGRVTTYRAHNEIGRRLLQQAGSDPLTSQWAYEHELPEWEWTIDVATARVLHQADDD